MKPVTVKERETALPHPSKLLKLFQIIVILRAGRWAIKQLVDRLDVSKSSLYRYVKMLEEAGFCVETDSHNRYFIVPTDDDPLQAQFTIEEMNLICIMMQHDRNHPLTASILKKLSQHPAMERMPRIFLKPHLGILVEQITNAKRTRHQIILKNYFSANSSEVRDRLVEPVNFGDNYATLIALDVEEKICKQFKLERIEEVVETHTVFQHEDLHQLPHCDLFGLSGKTLTNVTLQLSARAYLLLREEYPLSLPYLNKRDNKVYTFTGPVASYAGIGRFVLGLIDEIEIVEPEEFREYVRKRLESYKTLQKRLF